jgi:hypothetical protein
MRRGFDETPVTNDPQHPWRAMRQLRFGDRIYKRNEIIPNEIVDAALNVTRLIEGRYIARMPEPKATPIAPALAELLAHPKTVTPSDPWAECRAVLKAEATRRNIPVRVAGGMRHNLERVEMAIRHRCGTSAHRPVDKLYDELFAD